MKSLLLLLSGLLAGCNSVPNYYGYKGNCREQSLSYIKVARAKGYNCHEVILLLSDNRLHEVVEINGIYVDPAFKQRANSVEELHKGCIDVTEQWREILK